MFCQRFFNIILLSFLCCAAYTQVTGNRTFFPAVNTIRVTDMQRQKEVTINRSSMPLMLFVFMSPECPLCQNYTKVINDIQQHYKQQVEVYAIIPGTAYDANDISAFQKKYHTSFQFFIDKKMQLTKYLGASVTPQVVLLNSEIRRIYSGAIDDWAISVVKKRTAASHHYLADAIEQSLQNRPVLVAGTKAIGCSINDY